MSTLADRYEILFVYECTDCNPNGDPLDENRPRTDPETGVATVTDVRIKRTVRDYLLSLEPDGERRLASGMEILVRDTWKADGTLSEGKDRAAQFLDAAAKGLKGLEKRKALEDAILEGCIDVRLFGAALPVGKNEASIQVTGPVQFSAFNRSLHRVTPTMVQQTAAYAGTATAAQKSFAERWLLPYALIAASAVVNEVAARESRMSRADLDRLVQALWKGTAGLNSHSKVGHDPLLLVLAEYESGHRLGGLPRRVRMQADGVADSAIRTTGDYALDIEPLITGLRDCPSRRSVHVRHDPRLRCRAGGSEGAFADLARRLDLPVASLEL